MNIFHGSFTLGGTAVISGNTVNTINTINNNAPDNVYLTYNSFITLGTGNDAPVPGEMNVGVQTATPSGVIIESGANASHAQYFFADEPGKTVIYANGQLLIASVITDYMVTVSSAGMGATGSGNYAPGETVPICAGTPPAGMQFKNWTSSLAVTFANVNSPCTTFKMPDGPLTVTANFEQSATSYVADFNDLKEVISLFGGGDKDVTISVGASFGITERFNIYNDNDKILTITSADPTNPITLTRDIAGCLFTVNGGASLTLENIIIDGAYPDNKSALVCVKGGEFTMNDDAVLRNNGGSGVYITNSGKFTMPGGEITDNNGGHSDLGGGAMIPEIPGGGVYVDGGTFNMTGGKISNNTALGGYGGGVYVFDGEFSFGGDAVISGNYAMTGGGVYIENSTFTMTGGAVISGNTVDDGGGGGVYVADGAFKMTGGKISGNATSGNLFFGGYGGGGVNISHGSFTLGGTAVISGNTVNTINNNAPDNVYLIYNSFITLGTGNDAPVPGMNIGIRTDTPSGFIVPGGCYALSAFHADEPGKEVTCVGSDLVIASTQHVSIISITQSLVTSVGETKTLIVTRQNTDDFTVSVSPAYGSGCVKSGGNAVVCTPTATGTYTVTVTATAEPKSSASAQLTVTPATVSIAISPATASVTVGASRTFTVTTQNTPDYTLSAPVAAGCAKSGNTVTCTPTAAGTYTVTLAATADTTKQASAQLTANPPASLVPTVTSVTVNPSTATVQAGAGYQFGATVVGTNSPSPSVTWGVSGNNNGGTSISASGLLTVATGETASTLTVKATSTVDIGKSGTATVTVNSNQLLEESIFVKGMRPEFQVGLARYDSSWVSAPEFPGIGDVEFAVAGGDGPFVLWVGIQDVYPKVMLDGINTGEIIDVSDLFYDVAVPYGVSGVEISFFEDVWYGDFSEGDVITLLKTYDEGLLVFERNGVYYEKTFIADGSNPFPGEEPGVEPVVTVPSAAVEKLSGGKEKLTISLTETLSDGSTVTGNVAVTINENTAGYYTVGSHLIYVDALGSESIRRCFIVNRD